LGVHGLAGGSVVSYFSDHGHILHPLLPSGPQAEMLVELLSEARHLGFLGPGPVEAQIARSEGFLVAARSVPKLAIDLGSGGGLPGLVLAASWPTSGWLLVDSNQRRCAWLSEALRRLGAADRCEVICDRAENVGRGARRHSADLVTARSFAPPSPTAECAAPLLRLGGDLLVADPPASLVPGVADERWSIEGLALLGLQLDYTYVVTTFGGPVTVSRLTAASKCPTVYPRRVGVPFKRRLF
jgi:16S rRNA (guanine527-N7)-methyltransferase